MNVRGCLEVITLWLSVTRSWQRLAHRRAGKLFRDGPYLLALTTPRGILGQKTIGSATKATGFAVRRFRLQWNRLG